MGQESTAGTACFNRKISSLTRILEEMQASGFADNEHLKRWLETLPQLAESRRSFSLPLTCIGPVKSGKSTLINTLAGNDLLPTGAGITTSFPTTVRAGRGFTARIKLLPEIVVNELFSRSALLLFSDDFPDQAPNWQDEDDRQRITTLLTRYRSNKALTRHGIFDESYRLLQNLVRGATQVLPYYQQERIELLIECPDDELYRTFIRDESLAVYLREIVIQSPLKYLPPYLALRDLPGLDTPNPSHQSLIIQQLSDSPALLYVISSRIGLRQADYQLLEHLHELGLSERLIFILNLDLDEHRDHNEIERITTRCRDELEELGFDQPLFSFSALALAWSRTETKLEDYQRRRLEGWRREPDKLAFSVSGAQRFFAWLDDLGHNQATTALLEHSEKRFNQILAGCCRLLEQRRKWLLGQSSTLASAEHQTHSDRRTLQKLSREAERIVQGVGHEIESFAFQEIEAWLTRHGKDSLREKLLKIITEYQPPLEQIPDKNRNPLTPVRIIGNHFQLTVPPRLKERVAITVVSFLNQLQPEISLRFREGCLPLLVIAERFNDQTATAKDLPLPVKITSSLPEFELYSEAEKRFALLSRLREHLRLWSRWLGRRKRDSLGRSYTEQLIQETSAELPRWLSNYAEQLKYLVLRPYIASCGELSLDFFRNLLVGSESAYDEDHTRLVLEQQEKVEMLRKTEELLQKASAIEASEIKPGN
jgi:GTPase SAR1 family protein